MTRSTFSNLFRLVEADLLTSNSIAIFLYCKLYEGNRLSPKAIADATGLSGLCVRHHLNIMNALNIIEWRPTKGKSVEIICKELNDEGTTATLRSSKISNIVANYKDTKMNKYTPKGYMVDSKTQLKKESENLKIILEHLPDTFQPFRITPAYEHHLNSIAKEIDIADYCKWFMQKKLGKKIATFSMGIFLYRGMIEEYKVLKHIHDKQNAYKKVSVRKASFEAEAIVFEEEMKQNGVRK
jgi:hypothetical protein